MLLKQFVIPAKAGIQENSEVSGFPIKSGMTSVWKTLILYIGLMFDIIASDIPLAHADINIENPLGPRTTSITDLITSIIGQLTPVAVVIAVFAIIVVGFQFVLAAVQGEPGKIKESRKNLMWVLIGVGIIVSARLLAEAAKVFFSNL